MLFVTVCISFTLSLLTVILAFRKIKGNYMFFAIFMMSLGDTLFYSVYKFINFRDKFINISLKIKTVCMQDLWIVMESLFRLFLVL